MPSLLVPVVTVLAVILQCSQPDQPAATDRASMARTNSSVALTVGVVIPRTPTANDLPKLLAHQTSLSLSVLDDLKGMAEKEFKRGECAVLTGQDPLLDRNKPCDQAKADAFKSGNLQPTRPVTAGGSGSDVSASVASEPKPDETTPAPDPEPSSKPPVAFTPKAAAGLALTCAMGDDRGKRESPWVISIGFDRATSPSLRDHLAFSCANFMFTTTPSLNGMPNLIWARIEYRTDAAIVPVFFGSTRVTTTGDAESIVFKQIVDN